VEGALSRSPAVEYDSGKGGRHDRTHFRTVRGFGRTTTAACGRWSSHGAGVPPDPPGHLL